MVVLVRRQERRNGSAYIQNHQNEHGANQLFLGLCRPYTIATTDGWINRPCVAEDCMHSRRGGGSIEVNGTLEAVITNRGAEAMFQKLLADDRSRQDLTDSGFRYQGRLPGGIDVASRGDHPVAAHPGDQHVAYGSTRRPNRVISHSERREARPLFQDIDDGRCDPMAAFGFLLQSRRVIVS